MKKKVVNDKPWNMLRKEDRKKLDNAREKFLNDNKGFFDFLKKFPTKDFQECINRFCAQSYLEFLKNYDAKLYERFISDESIGEYYNRNKNPFGGMSPESLNTIIKIIRENIDKSGLHTSDKNEQKLFELIFEEEKKQKKLGRKFEPYKTFKGLNDIHKLVDPSLILKDKFTNLKVHPNGLYNRYNQYRNRYYKKQTPLRKKIK